MEELVGILKRYSLNNEDVEIINKSVNNIYKHPEFQRRMKEPFFHHGKITLGQHILEDTILTYKLSKMYLKKYGDSSYDLDAALKISMIHDLYTVPWQNNLEAKVKRFFNKHGFRHPIEAIINAYNWFPEIFKDKNIARIIIDGVLHHMHPLPVLVFKDGDNNILELKNFELANNLSNDIKDIILKSTNRGKIGSISIAKSKYLEGRIMSKADKRASRKQIKNISSAVALVTGHNKSLRK